MNHGSLIKRLREERNLTQSALSEGIIARSSLASFEQKNSKISFENLITLIGRMNLTLEEYEYLRNEETINQKKDYAIIVSQAFNRPYDGTLTTSLLSLYNETNDFFYYNLYCQYVAVRYISGDKEDTCCLIDEVSENVKVYLDSIDTWGNFELILFSNCLFLFEENYIHFQLQDSIKKMMIYDNQSNYSALLTNFLINALNVSFTREAFLLFEECLKELSLINTIETKLFVRLFTFLRNRKNGLNNPEEEKELVQFFRLVNEPYWINFINEE